MTKGLIEIIQEKWSITKETPHKDRLDHIPKRQKKYKKYQKEGINLVNPDVTEKGTQKCNEDIQKKANNGRAGRIKGPGKNGISA